MPAQAAISHDTIRDAREEDSNPPRLGRGDTRGSTEARDHFIHAPVAECIRHPPSKWDDAGENPAGSTTFLSTHRVCGPPVKRCELGAMPRGGAISQTERVRLVEDAVLKTAAPAMVSGVRVPGAPPLHSPAWCKSSTLDSQPGNPGASPGAGADFIHPLAQKESGRPTPGRPGSVTSSGDHFHSSVAQKQSNRPITDRPRRDTARRDPRWMAESVNAPG